MPLTVQKYQKKWTGANFHRPRYSAKFGIFFWDGENWRAPIFIGIFWQQMVTAEIIHT